MFDPNWRPSFWQVIGIIFLVVATGYHVWWEHIRVPLPYVLGPYDIIPVDGYDDTWVDYDWANSDHVTANKSYGQAVRDEAEMRKIDPEQYNKGYLATMPDGSRKYWNPGDDIDSIEGFHRELIGDSLEPYTLDWERVLSSTQLDSYNKMILKFKYEENYSLSSNGYIVSYTINGKNESTVWYSQVADNWSEFLMYDPIISNEGSTIYDSGCGPSSAAIAVSTLTGRYVTPAQMAVYWTVTGNMATDGSAGSWAGPKVSMEAYGLTAVEIESAIFPKDWTEDKNTNCIEVLKNNLKTGTIAISVGTKKNGASKLANSDTYSPYTGAGHFICIVGYDKVTDEFIISDPAKGEVAQGVVRVSSDILNEYSMIRSVTLVS
jgi:hypothetical protein